MRFCNHAFDFTPNCTPLSAITIINRTNSSKSLGGIIDEHLRWKEQIDSISIIKSYCNYSTSKKICFTRYIRTNVSFFSSPIPYFDYCSLVWNNCSQTLKDKVQRLQNRAARVITGDNYDIRSSDIFNKLGWNNLQDRRNSQTMNYVTNFRLF